jgi:hypothetical protein
MTPAEQYRRLVDRLQAISEDTPGRPDSTFKDPKNANKLWNPTWPPQQASNDLEREFMRFWNNDITPAQKQEVDSWPYVVDKISKFWHIPPKVVSDWVEEHRRQPAVLADPSQHTPYNAMPWLMANVKVWTEEKFKKDNITDGPWQQQPLGQEPRIFDPKAPTGKVTPWLDNDFDPRRV